MEYIKKEIKGNRERGFTLIELLVTISIVSLLSTIVMTSITGARDKARDAKRMSDMEQIRLALNMYHSAHGIYPAPVSADDDWEVSNEDGGDFIDVLTDEGYFPNGTPLDPVNSAGMYYYYYRYGAGDADCPVGNGDFYVLGISDMETGSGTYPSSPGWTCVPATRNWQEEFEWVTGGFTN